MKKQVEINRRHIARRREAGDEPLPGSHIPALIAQKLDELVAAGYQPDKTKAICRAISEAHDRLTSR